MSDFDRLAALFAGARRPVVFTGVGVYIPIHAKRAGATLAIVTLEPTRADGDADLGVRASAGAVMTAVLDAVRLRIPQGG